jgi:hypothetical protein
MPQPLTLKFSRVLTGPLSIMACLSHFARIFHMFEVVNVRYVSILMTQRTTSTFGLITNGTSSFSFRSHWVHRRWLLHLLRAYLEASA